jgi:lipid-binding SYLF domain-containing protein
MHGLSRIGAGVLAGALAVVMLTGGPAPAFADDAQDARQLVDKARLTVEGFAADPDMDGFRSLIKRAKGVYVAPQVLRGAFIFGVSGGSGVFLARDEKAGQWSGPAFYTIGEASFGLQAGADASEVILLVMSERGIAALQSSSVKLGADVGIAVGPVGAGASASTANLSADIITYARAKGLYAGISLEGAVVATRDALNRAYYGKDVTPTDVLIRRAVTNPQSAGLIETIAKVAGGQ